MNILKKFNKQNKKKTNKISKNKNSNRYRKTQLNQNYYDPNEKIKTLNNTFINNNINNFNNNNSF